MKLIDAGDKLHVVTRRLFSDNVRRHFAGEIVAVDGVIARVEGFTFIYDEKSTTFKRTPQRQTSIYDLAESGYIVNIIPRNVDIDQLHYKTVERTHVIVTDGGDFSLGINEFGVNW